MNDEPLRIEDIRELPDDEIVELWKMYLNSLGTVLPFMPSTQERITNGTASFFDMMLFNNAVDKIIYGVKFLIHSAAFIPNCPAWRTFEDELIERHSVILDATRGQSTMTKDEESEYVRRTIKVGAEAIALCTEAKAKILFARAADAARELEMNTDAYPTSF